MDPIVSAKYSLDSANIVTMAVSANTLYCTLTPITGATGTTVITVVATAQSGAIKSAQAPITLA